MHVISLHGSLQISDPDYELLTDMFEHYLQNTMFSSQFVCMSNEYGDILITDDMIETLGDKLREGKLSNEQAQLVTNIIELRQNNYLSINTTE